MAEMKCPLCHQPVSQELFERITGIWKERRVQEKLLRDKQRELLKQQREGKKQLSAERRRLKAEQKGIIEKKVADQTKKYASQIAKIEAQKAKIRERAEKRITLAVKSAERKARLTIGKDLKGKFAESVRRAAERVSLKTEKNLFRVNQTLESTKKQMSTLQKQNAKQQEQIKNLETQLKNQTTPQLEGLLYEETLMEALQKEFPEDRLSHTGKGGDILQEVVFEKEGRGLLVYECKKVSQWQSAHAEQAAVAKLQRKADYAILRNLCNEKRWWRIFCREGRHSSPSWWSLGYCGNTPGSND